ncbi:ribonuclease T [Endozoicomonas euniceicola]|uniref:Ribonuclease T n=1 Tax=Endozoicomonas euniceicola TaxID=1234143 RepID=A0ABY6H1L3_9GAMM|nr:ribonuclease T [Endozoicomonas euniceicola]UYM18950.1 ribonuclease T [Endozoicomonas euniceicola]
MANRFRGFLPVVVDVETGGFNPATDALLEIAAVVIEMDEMGYVHPCKPQSFHIKPFEGANIEKAAIEFIGVDPFHPLRIATEEEQAVSAIFKNVRKEVKRQGCSRAVLVGHNASFDLSFLMAAAERNDIKRNPFHPFSCFDTATLGGLAYGQTVLAKACEEAHVSFDKGEAHSARYDTEKTAELFCAIVNQWKDLGGWL